jgi:subtilisin-like proprotein convertase family protein
MKRHAYMLIAMCSGVALAGEVCVSPLVSIPDNNAAGIDIPIVVVAGANEQVDAVTLSIEIDHPWVGDLVISLVSPDGTTLTLLDRPGIPSNGFPGPFGCGGRDLDAVFSDDASQAAEDVCSYSAQPVIVGSVVPIQSLANFAGEAAGGVWTLRVSDLSAFDTGVVLESCLNITTSIVCTPDLNGDGVLDFFDVSAFLSAFTSQDPIADFTGDGQFNFFDVSAFLNAFSAGCP